MEQSANESEIPSAINISAQSAINRPLLLLLKADYEKKHDEVADTNDWCFSPWLQEEITPLKKNRMENEIKNRLTVAPSSVIRPVGA